MAAHALRAVGRLPGHSLGGGGTEKPNPSAVIDAWKKAAAVQSQAGWVDLLDKADTWVKDNVDMSSNSVL